jgi:hypothetical protein
MINRNIIHCIVCLWTWNQRNGFEVQAAASPWSSVLWATNMLAYNTVCRPSEGSTHLRRLILVAFNVLSWGWKPIISSEISVDLYRIIWLTAQIVVVHTLDISCFRNLDIAKRKMCHPSRDVRSRSRSHEELCLMEYDAVQSTESQPTFQRKIASISLSMNKPREIPSWSRAMVMPKHRITYETGWRRHSPLKRRLKFHRTHGVYPEDRTLQSFVFRM